MTILQSIFLGLLQGFTEFLPISSSGHLLLAQKLFGIDADLFYDVMLHIGTLLAVCVAFRRSLWQIITHPVSDNKLLYLVIACVPTFVIALVVKLFISESLMNALLPIGFALTIVLIVLSDKLSKPRLKLQSAPWWVAVVTGAVQGVAVFPGLSRSGSTISAMKLCGVDGTDSAEFSFLLSIPVIIASAVVELWEVIKLNVTINWLCIAVGVVCAFVSGLVATSMVMRAIKTRSWIAFAVYLAIPLVISLIIM